VSDSAPPPDSADGAAPGALARAAFVHPTAVVDLGAVLGPGVEVWHFCHVSADARLGAGARLGQNVYIGPGVSLGAGVKVQNNVSVYEGVTVEDEVFLGPSCVLTNVRNPRAARRGRFEGICLRRGATIGANATILPGVTVGRYAFVAAGAVVSRDVPDHALVVGVPACQVGWVTIDGERCPSPPP
jgi:UDP-2-acetamido-3-amino-2,3-dideoxy-glucuronate N-acetyltransferase